MNWKRDIITSAVNRNIKAEVTFDGRHEVFTWEGDFEEFKVEFESWLTYDNVQFVKGDYLLEIRYDKGKDKEEATDYLSHLPYLVKLDTKYFDRSFLKNYRDEYDSIIGEIKYFFEKGRPINFDIFSPKAKEILEILIFGYFTYKRFIDCVEKHFPDFFKKIRSYGGKPITEIMDVFKSSNISREELEIEIKKAINREEFEKAAFLRDKLKSLK